MRYLYVLISFFLFHTLASADPSITNIVSSTGSSLTHKTTTFTITGTDFGSKSPAKPQIWADGETNDIEPDNTYCVLNAWSGYNYGGPSIDSTGGDQPHGNSTYTMRQQISEANPSVGMNTDMGGTFTTAYSFLRRWEGFTQSGGSIKPWRVWSGSGGDLYIDMHGLKSTQDCDCEASGGGDENNFYCDDNLGMFCLPDDEWYTQEALFDTTAGGSGNLYFELINNSETDYLSPYAPTSTNHTWGGSDPDEYNVQLHLSNQYTTAYVYFDDIYIDNTWARVMIGNNETFSLCTVKEIQLPSAWSTTSITVTYQEGAIVSPTNGSWYLFVVKSDNTVSGGYNLDQLGLSSAPTAQGISAGGVTMY